MPKSYIIWKWTVYSLATLALFALQYLVLNQIEVWGLRPFLYPMLPAVVSSYEGLRRGSVFSLFLGMVCDILLAGPFEGFFTLTFAVIGLLSGRIGESALPSGWLCGLLVSALALLLTGGARILVQFLAGGGYLALMGQITLQETLLTLPALIAVLPLYRHIFRKLPNEY